MLTIKAVPEKMIDELTPLFFQIFGELKDSELNSLISHVKWIQLKSGEYLFHQNDIGDHLFLVVHGKLKVQRIIDAKKVKLKELFRGEIVGEMALISDHTRNADVIAVRDCNLISISKIEFELLYAKHPLLGLHISKLIIQRLQPNPRYRKSKLIKNVALFPGNKPVNAIALIEQIRESFSDRKIFIAQSKSDLISMSGNHNEDISLSHMIQICNTLEHEYDLIFFLTGNEISEWTRFCLRQSDEILILYNPDNLPQPTEQEKEIFSNEHLVDCSVVFLHEKSTKIPKNSASFLHYKKADNIFHIREGNQKDFRRLVRYLLQESTGLVLAGGGARGMAHLGVWKALLEQGIEIDMIGGTSMGAFLGGLMSFDWNYEAIYEICREISLSKPSRDLNPIPYASIIQGKNLDRVLKKYYLQHDLEDCLIPFFCISTDMNSSRSKTHMHGNMFRAIRASGSLPGVVPPVPINGRWHVDGGIFDNFPVNKMVHKGIQKIIGVSFMSEESIETSHLEIPTVMDQFRHGILKTEMKFKIPSLIETVMMSTLANSYKKQKQAEKQVDILITPDVSDYGLLDWKAFDKVVEIGYKAALNVL